MSNKIIQMVIFIFLSGLLFFPACKTAEDAAQYTLTVTVGEGVSGVPAAGSYPYSEGDTVTYNYTLEAGYENLEVRLDGVPAANSGVITMNMNHTLTVTTDEKFNPTGDWEGWLYAGGGDFFASISFSGDYASGTVSGDIDSAGTNGTGTYSISGNNIEFFISYSAGTIEFTGTIDDNDHMSGEFQVVTGGSTTGTWTLSRQ